MHVTITEMALVMMAAIAAIYLGATAVCSIASPTHKVDSIISQLLNIALAILAGCVLAATLVISGSGTGKLVGGLVLMVGLLLGAAVWASIDVAKRAAMGKRKIRQRRYRRLRTTQAAITIASLIFGVALIGLGAAGLQ
jgi:hypothetical protein